MSAALCGDSVIPQDIEDDRESAFWVLLWTALSYSKNNISDSGSLAGLMEMFDYVASDGSGGGLKISFLFGRADIHFTGRPQLGGLVEELRRAFAVRYRPDPVVEYGDDDPNLLNLLTNKRKEQIDKIKERSWLVDIIRRYLESGEWPGG